MSTKADLGAGLAREWRMTWEQRFGALIELDGDEWDAMGGERLDTRNGIDHPNRLSKSLRVQPHGQTANP